MTIRKQDIVRGLRKMSLGEGDIVLLHSSLSSLGRVEGGADAVIDAFLEVIGEDGTLVVPIFGSLGVITERLQQRDCAVTSIHPKAGVAALGAAAEAICREHWQADMAHGPDTPYTRIAEMGGYVCLLGVDQDRNTTLHTVEELLKLPYLKTTDEVTFETPKGRVTKAWTYFPGPHRDFIGIDRELRESGKLRIGQIGNARVRIIRGADLIELAMALGKADPAFVLCDNPACRDCTLQRADLSRARFRQEPFTVVAAASLAGDYAEEIAETCRLAGIDAVEIDAVRGVPLTRLQPRRLRETVETLRREEIDVRALRLLSIGKGMDCMLDVASDLGVRRVVAPLTAYAPKQAEYAAGKEIQLAFANVAVDAHTALEMLRDIVAQGLDARLAFGPAQFVVAGENPFLKSFRSGLRRFVDQLDIEDHCFDGRPAPLANGNAEIKELISILRCRCFDGVMLLSRENRRNQGLPATVKQFERLLHEM